MAPGTYLVGGRLGWCYPKTRAITHGRSSREGWARARGARGRRRLGRDCGDVCSVRESRTITLKVRRRASAGHSRVQRGESGLRRRSVRESGTITLKVRRRASAGHSRVQRGESGLRRRSVRESGTITLKVRRRASAGHSRVQGGESGLRRRSVRESGTIFKGGKAPPEAVSGRATYTTATANNAAIYSRLGISTVIFQTQSMLLQASRRVFP